MRRKSFFRFCPQRVANVWHCRFCSEVAWQAIEVALQMCRLAV